MYRRGLPKWRKGFKEVDIIGGGWTSLRNLCMLISDNSIRRKSKGLCGLTSIKLQYDLVGAPLLLLYVPCSSPSLCWSLCLSQTQMQMNSKCRVFGQCAYIYTQSKFNCHHEQHMLLHAQVISSYCWNEVMYKRPYANLVQCICYVGWTVDEVCTTVASPPRRCDVSWVVLLMKSEGLLEIRTGEPVVCEDV